MSCADIMKVLSDDTRLSVLQHLITGARQVKQLNSELQIDPTLLSHHLRVLREAGLVVTKREGRHVLYRIAPAVRVTGQRRSLNFGCCTLQFKNKRGISQ